VTGLEFPFALNSTSSLPVLAGLLAYGPGPGVELIPYFLGLLAWMGLALAAVLGTPLSALLRLVRRRRGQEKHVCLPTADPTPLTHADGNPSPPLIVSAPEPRGESHDKA
jgi:hypothetical protein